MSPIILIAAFFPLIMVLIAQHNDRKINEAAIQQIVKKRKNKEELDKMIEASKELIGKDVFIKTISDFYQGILKEIKGNALVLEEKGELINVNADYIISIKEYPHKANGKRKTVM